VKLKGNRSSFTSGVTDKKQEDETTPKFTLRKTTQTPTLTKTNENKDTDKPEVKNPFVTLRKTQGDKALNDLVPNTPTTNEQTTPPNRTPPTTQ